MSACRQWDTPVSAAARKLRILGSSPSGQINGKLERSGKRAANKEHWSAMSGKVLPRIRAVLPLPEYCLGVALEGQRGGFVVSLADMIAKGGVFKGIENKNVFESVRVDGRRRAIFWPRPLTPDGEPMIDIDADALVEMARSQAMSH
jgi:hypothetical protein